MSDIESIRRPTTTEQRITDVVNVAADDVKEWLDWRLEDRDTDLVNLLVNVIVHRLTRDEDDEVTDIVRDAYDGLNDEEADDEAEVVLGWFA